MSHGIINILTDLIIVLIPLAVLWNVQIKRAQKRAIFSAFMVRIV